MSIGPKHPKRRGEWAELQFMARAASYGLKLCKPWGESARYDVTVEHASGFHRVQVKSTTCVRHNRWWCSMPKRIYMPDEFDYLAVYIIPKDVWYIIPSAEICGHSSHAIQLLDPSRDRGKYRQYLEAWHLLGKNPELSMSQNGL